jgi:hypothetical protein
MVIWLACVLLSRRSVRRDIAMSRCGALPATSVWVFFLPLPLRTPVYGVLERHVDGWNLANGCAAFFQPDGSLPLRYSISLCHWRWPFRNAAYRICCLFTVVDACRTLAVLAFKSVLDMAWRL